MSCHICRRRIYVIYFRVYVSLVLLHLVVSVPGCTVNCFVMVMRFVFFLFSFDMVRLVCVTAHILVVD